MNQPKPDTQVNIMSDVLRDFTEKTAQKTGFTFHCPKCDYLMAYMYIPKQGLQVTTWCDQCQKMWGMWELKKKEVE